MFLEELDKRLKLNTGETEFRSWRDPSVWGGAYSVLAFGCYAVHAVVTEVIVNFGPWKPDRWGSVTEM